MEAESTGAFASNTPHKAGNKEKLKMEFVLNSTTEILVVGFVLVMGFDFVAGLLTLYRSCAPMRLEPQATPEPTTYELFAGGVVVEPTELEPATLRWLQAAIAVAVTEEDDAGEPFNVIELAKKRQPKALEVAKQPQPDYSQMPIRKLKKLASERRIKNYNVMKKIELVSVLSA